MKRIIFISLNSIILLFLLFGGCKKSLPDQEVKPFVSSVKHADWTKNMVLYEVNVRQFTHGGTFKEMVAHLPRLKDLGVDVLWFMPIHPIGELNRKGELGSYYSVRDYRQVNPEFGTMDDFINLVNRIHETGMYVMIDWVPNHTAWDNPLVTDHPEWYVKDSLGHFVSPYDWTDVIQLDWTNRDMQKYQLEALKFWVQVGVDGFRVDHPHKTPYEFWEKARTELEKIRPVLLLAENEDQTRFLEKGFDMNYAWELHHLMNRVAQGKDSIQNIDRYFEREQAIYPPDVYRMRFIDNHDENAWAGTINERLGEAHEAFAVFMFTIPGVPLLYNGQEACLNKRLEFFIKDTIDWVECDKTGFYKTLIRMKKENTALWNGASGGPMHRIYTPDQPGLFAFSRENDTNRIVVFLNLSPQPIKIKPVINHLAGDYTCVFECASKSLPLVDSLPMDPWEYIVLTK